MSIVQLTRKTFDYLMAGARLAHQQLGTGARRLVPRQGGLAGPNIQYVECTSTTATSSLYPGRLKEYTVVSDGSLITTDPEVVVWLRFPNDEVPTEDVIYGCLFAGIRTADDVAIFEGLFPIGSPSGTATVTPLVQGRLSRSSSGPLPIDSSVDGSGDATIYFHRFEGKYVTLYNGSTWDLHEIPSAGVSVAVPSTSFRKYDIYLYDNAGTLTLETVDWVEETGSITAATAANPCVITSTGHSFGSESEAIAITGITGTLGTNAARGLNGKVFYVSSSLTNTLTLVPSDTSGLTYTSGGTWHRLSGTSLGRTVGFTNIDGMLTKFGDSSRLYLGTAMTLESATPDTKRRRLLANAHNRRLRLCEATRLEDTALGTFSGTAAVAAFARQAMAGQIMIIAPAVAVTGSFNSWDSDIVKDARTSINYTSDTAGEYLVIGIGAGPPLTVGGTPTFVGVPETMVPESTTQVLLARSYLLNDHTLSNGVFTSNATALLLLDPIFVPSSGGAVYTLSDLGADMASGLQTRRLQAMILS